MTERIDIPRCDRGSGSSFSSGSTNGNRDSWTTVHYKKPSTSPPKRSYYIPFGPYGHRGGRKYYGKNSSSDEDSDPTGGLFSRIVDRIDVGESRGYRVEPNINIGRVGDKSMEKWKPSRAGVIPYTVDKDGEIIFAMGSDFNSANRTDFGGGIKFKTDYTIVRAALRELQEESLGVFGRVDEHSDNVQNALAIYNDDMIILFIRIDFNPTMINTLFMERLKCRDKCEIREIVTLNRHQFITGIMNNGEYPFYSKVREHLHLALRTYDDFTWMIV